MELIKKIDFINKYISFLEKKKLYLFYLYLYKFKLRITRLKNI